MRLLMVSGDRQVAVGERGPFHSMQREFSRYFERVDVLCPRPPGPVVVRSIHDNVHLHPATCGRLGMMNFVREAGALLIGRFAHRLIVSHDYGWFYNGFGAARLSASTGVPYLSEIHHVPGVPVASGLRERFDRFVARRYVSWARRRAIAFRVVNREEMPNLLVHWGVPLSRIVVLPSLYIDLEVFRPTEPRPAFEQDLVFVGRLVKNKGVERIIDAMALLAGRGRRLSALFVGRGPLRQALEERVRSRGLGGAVRFVDWVDTPSELAEAYRRSRLCVCASTCEGGPRFTVEAMACGTPVVSTPVGVMGDLVGDGRAGAIAGFDAAGLAASIERVLSDEAARAEMGRAAVGLATPFEYSRAIGVYANGLRRLVGEPELSP